SLILASPQVTGKIFEGSINRTVDIDDNCSEPLIEAQELDVITLDDGSIELTELFIITDASGNTTEVIVVTIFLSDTEAPVLVSCTVDEVILEIDEEGRVVGRDEGSVFIFNFDEVVDNLEITDNCSLGFFIEYNEDENGVLVNGPGRIFANDGTNFSEDFCDVIITGMLEPVNQITPSDKWGKTTGRANEIKASMLEIRSQLSESIKVEVNPNPFHTQTNLQVNLPQEEMVNIDMRDVSGRVVRSLSLKGNAGENTFVIQRNDLATGVYFISVRTASTQQTIKVVVTQ
ncbi:MAG: T9SS type A sorting domain-containing protein, partial [Bacteroidota bacterium]